MTTENIWDFIHSTYLNNDFSNFKNIGGLGIISIDNYYLVCYYTSDNNVIMFKIVKDYNLIKSSSTYTITDVRYGEFNKQHRSIIGDDESLINYVHTILIPIIREFKLKEIGV